jgi:Flp pilus assembly protein TadG
VIRSNHPPCRRRGAIVPLAALLLVPLLAMMAFALDVGWMVLVESNLQNAADSAALAGANSLIDGYVQFVQAGITTSSTSQSSILSTYEANATAAAQQFAALNGAGNSSLTLLSSDVQFGYTDGSGNYTTPAPSGTYPNTIKVTLSVCLGRFQAAGRRYLNS